MIQKIIKNTQINKMVLILSAVIGLISLLYFRMKTIDQDYSYAELNKKIKLAVAENKQIKAGKAKLVSNESLQLLAKRHVMRMPNNQQLIIINDKQNK